jgi:hypothetical protein
MHQHESVRNNAHFGGSCQILAVASKKGWDNGKIEPTLTASFDAFPPYASNGTPN